MKNIILYVMLTSPIINILAQSPTYTLPGDYTEHEATWLQWPHHYTYGTTYRNRIEPTFIEMAAALVPGEKVYIIAYNASEKTRIMNLLTDAGISLSNITFYIIKTDDCWSRDNGPMYVYDEVGDLTLLDWNFDGWGNDAPYTKDNKVPQTIATKTGVPRIDLSAMVLEGGAVEVDGAGTFLATRSSITGDGRNTGLTEAQVNEYLTQYLGVTNIVWLDGLYGAMWDITDTHIDGFARLLDSTTLVTMDETDLDYWGLSSADITTLMNMQNANGDVYNKIYLPLTNKNVKTTWGANVGFKASYNNYYVGNTVVLFSTYNDIMDDDAIAIMETLYPDKTIVPIDSRNLYYYGGMIHCVTQQQPVANPLKKAPENFTSAAESVVILQNYPNPFSDKTQIQFYVKDKAQVEIEIFTLQGIKLKAIQVDNVHAGTNTITISLPEIPSGTYMYYLHANGTVSEGKLMTITK